MSNTRRLLTRDLSFRVLAGTVTSPLTLILTPTTIAGGQALAYDVNEQLSISGILAASGQSQFVSARLPSETYGSPLDESDPTLLDTSMDEFGDETRGGMPFQLEVNYHPNAATEFFVKLGFAADNALNTVSPWVLAPWAADLEDDVQDINGSGRDYLLSAWYKHSFKLANDGTLGATFGIIDATEYLDGNAFANDEYTQFMNEVFANAANYGLPSFAPGAALEWSSGPWSFNAVGMNIAENDDGNNFNFWGVQGGYQVESSLGVGNYRVLLVGTSSAFLDPTATKEESLFAGGLSFDQELGKVVGVFLRTTWQTEDAAVDYQAIYSGGLNFNGGGWGRESDTIGIGYAYLDGGNLDLESTQAVEGYYRLGLNDYVALTADVQYMSDDRIDVDALQEDPEGWVLGMRLTAEF